MSAAALPTEEEVICFWLGDKKHHGFAPTHGGTGRHIRQAKGQNVAGLADVLMWLPKRDGTELRVCLEIKIGDDRVSDVQWEMLAREERAGALVAVCRYGKCREGEMTQDECVAMIERALRA